MVAVVEQVEDQEILLGMAVLGASGGLIPQAEAEPLDQEQAMQGMEVIMRLVAETVAAGAVAQVAEKVEPEEMVEFRAAVEEEAVVALAQTIQMVEQVAMD